MHSTIDSGDTAWVLVSTALVLIMFPGLALFYGGLVKTKNVLSTFMHTFLSLAMVSLAWAVLGYSLAFGTDVGGVIGNLDHVFLQGVMLEPREGMAIPHLLFFVYQMMFAAITPALISGAFAERVKLSSFALFSLLWTILIYAPLAHWMWAPGGWLMTLGALDFAGGIVVHISSGISALVFALVIGPRVGFMKERHVPHNLTMTLLGAGLLWFGWFGFNGGSALASNGTAVLAVVNSQLAASAGAIVWMLLDLYRSRKASSLGFATGFVAGLATVTGASGFIAPRSAMMVGAIASLVCYGAVLLKDRYRYDDSLDAFGVHGVGGVLGSFLLAVFAEKAWNSAGADGLFTGTMDFFQTELLAIGVAIGWSVAGTWVVLKLVDRLVGLRVDGGVEKSGLDVSLHGEEGYSMGAMLASRSISEH